ncbi:acyl-[ACP]--phospholipid O-acyltransferase [Candidatus Thiosymbion oneisti]|uniref:acyl-[ACP]--phospholipid O-acyltransferase n=1 Tax=Candidatus Thiosymbion oneisti TaxID=589554 RepID=UPI000AADB32E|nr:acyl-[ACP]--phospholipid O-acyltransferase [Candidatus Thiosymbion oneisti]
MLQLFRITGFLPYLAVAFLNAFVDLGHKIIIQNTLFKTYEGDLQITLTAIVNALILLPFVLLFTPSGFLSDKYPKPQVMRISAWAAVGLTLAITACYRLGWFWPAFAMTFLLAVQSALYSPAKYGFIRELVGEDALSAANGVVQATVTAAIMAGIFFFSVLFEILLAQRTFTTTGEIIQLIAPVGWFLVGFSLLELALAYRLPERRPRSATMHFDWRAYRTGRYLLENLGMAYRDRVIWLSILGLAGFWSIAQVMLPAFPAFAEEVLGETNTVVIQGAMASFGIGIALGSVIAGRVSRGRIETGLIPIGALGIAVGLFVLPGLPSIWIMTLDFLAIGIMGGLFLVPLSALIQFNAQATGLGRVLAASNFVRNLVMLAFLGLTVVAARLESGSLAIIYALGILALVGTCYSLYQLPRPLMRFLVARVVMTRYRLEMIGLAHLPPQGGVLMLGNHISWIDWAVMQTASPRPIRFALDRAIYKRWYLRRFFDLFGVVPISRDQSRQALDTIAELLNAGEVVCLFPEEYISRTAQLGEFKQGFELAAAKVETGVILPFYLHGLWGSSFSFANARRKAQRRRRRERELVVAFGTPLPISATAAQVKQAVYELSVSAWQTFARTLPTLPEAWLRTAAGRRGQPCVLDAIGTALTNRRFMAAVFLFALRIRRLVQARNLGVLMPASSAGAIANMAVLLTGRTVVNLNYTAGREALRASMENAGIRNVITARRFLARLKDRGLDLGDLFDGIELHDMEDLKAGIGKAEGLLMLTAASILPAGWAWRLFGHRAAPEDTAAILFSSGSEGAPKGIELTHRNLIANVRQISDLLALETDDRVLSNLPPFHAFGLTVTSFMPLLEGIPMICHPDPTDALGCAKAIARERATILFSPPTFLRLHTRNKHIHPMMLESLRMVVAGAERLNRDVREAFALKFHKPIYEGYGTTETAPVASCNLPDRLHTHDWGVQIGHRPGTVGMPLPGTSFRVVDPVSLETLPPDADGLILIGGVQVMKGYLNAPALTADALVELDGQRWYKTGDKGRLDQDGFLTIVDRYSRFAKLGGEMISLTQVEEQVRQVLAEPELELAALTVPDPKKGERIILLIAADLDPDGLRRALIDAGMNPLTIPAEIRPVEQIPKLGSGKTDFPGAKKLALTGS